MNSETIVMCVVALILGMLLAHMLKNVCGCKVVEGREFTAENCWNGCSSTQESCQRAQPPHDHACVDKVYCTNGFMTF